MTISARDFIIGMRRAHNITEKQSLIDSYCGYNTRLSFGEQELSATSRAKRELSPVDTSGPTRSELRSAALSVAGYVAGMPNWQLRAEQDQEARQRLTSELADKSFAGLPVISK